MLDDLRRRDGGGHGGGRIGGGRRVGIVGLAGRCSAPWRGRRRPGAAAPRPAPSPRPAPASPRSRATGCFSGAISASRSVPAPTCWAARPVVRKDSAGPGHSRRKKAPAPRPKPAQTEIRRSWARSPSGRPKNSFASIVQKMAPVEQRNGKKVGQPDAYRNYSYQIEQRQKAHLGHFRWSDRRFRPSRGAGQAQAWPCAILRSPTRVSRMMLPVSVQAAQKAPTGCRSARHWLQSPASGRHR